MDLSLDDLISVSKEQRKASEKKPPKRTSAKAATKKGNQTAKQKKVRRGLIILAFLDDIYRVCSKRRRRM
jgi:hypothetical protein